MRVLTPRVPLFLQAAEGKAYSGYDYAKDTTSSSYDSALHSAYDSWQVGGPRTIASAVPACARGGAVCPPTTAGWRRPAAQERCAL